MLIGYFVDTQASLNKKSKFMLNMLSFSNIEIIITCMIIISSIHLSNNVLKWSRCLKAFQPQSRLQARKFEFTINTMYVHVV